MMNVDTNIQKNLTPDEKEVFSVIREIIAKYTPSTQAFAVGGWVRDKLLKIPSNDIDVMISNMSGEAFAKLVTRHLNLKNAHVIRENPEKSKFITTAKAYIPLSSGVTQEIDFAQARSEVYREDSRIPDLKPATPQEDAYRRDLTINSLFYNINDNKLEDFTGMGIKDLISNTFRTPLEPVKTFSDDPLRIFRVVRLAAKYNGIIDPQTYQAMNNPALRDEIKQKVSKERIGQEFLKMLKNPNPDYALKLLKDTGLWEDIIAEALKGTKYEGKMAQLDMNQNNVNHQLTLWEHTLQVVKNILNKYPEADSEKRITMVLAALTHDLGKLFKDIQGQSKSHPGNTSYLGHADESKNIAEYILKYLRIGDPYIKQVSGLAHSHMRPHHFTEQEQGGARALRKFLRNMGEASLNWLDVFNLAVADAYSKGLEIDPNTVKQYQELEQKLQEAFTTLSPTKDTSIKPILNGNEIMQILNVKPGAWMAEITNFVKELRDENPNITKEEAARLLKEKYQNINPKDIKKAGKEEKEEEKKNSICPMHLFNAKLEEINNLFTQDKPYEVLTILDDLRKEYGDDESVVRLLSIATFKLLLKGEKYRHNNLIQHILDKAEKNFFDSTLCAYVVGILILIPTKTEKGIIKEVGERVLNMAPSTLKKVINMLPEKVYHEDLRKEFGNENTKD